MTLVLLAAALLLAGCRATCEDACRRLEELGCVSSASADEPASCLGACRRAELRGDARLELGCVARARGCEEAAECTVGN